MNDDGELMISGSRSSSITLEQFRGEFVALETLAWLDTPGCPPAAGTVVESLRAALAAWETGDFSWQAWDETPDIARVELAELLGVRPEDVALVSSLSEAASTVARSLPRGHRVLVDEGEFRSNLFPWTAMEDRGDLALTKVPMNGAKSLTERFCEYIEDSVDLVAVSTALTSTGARPDLSAIAERARSVGAKIFINATQSFGVLQLDIARLRPDFVAAHGYKWMLAPRGCAWLYVRPDRLSDVGPLAPGWHTVERPNADYFGLGQPWSNQARKLDGALSWLPWIAGLAALNLLKRLDAEAVESRALGLARAARQGLEEMHLEVAASDQESHIVRVYASGGDELVHELSQRGVVASGGPSGFRVGFHGFNDNTDVARLLDGVAAWQLRRRER